MDEPGTIDVVSPSQLSVLRRCQLAAYLSLVRRTGRGAGTSNPRARLGTAAHEVLEWVARNASTIARSDDPEQQVRSRWLVAIRTQQEQAERSQQERTAGPAEQWPAAAQTQERVIVEGERLAVELSDFAAGRLIIEQELVGVSAPLRGIVDLVILDDSNGATVIDHKTGAVEQADIEPGGRFRTQVLVYSALCRDAGFNPTRAEIRSIGRRRIHIVVEEAAIDEAVDEAVRDVAAFNAEVRAGKVMELARPSSESCRWCEHMAHCPAIWGDVEPDLQDLHAVEGPVIGLERSRIGRISITINAERGTKRGPVLVAGLDSRGLTMLRTLAVGDRVRVAGLSEVAPDMAKLVARSGSWVRVRVVACVGPVHPWPAELWCRRSFLSCSRVQVHTGPG